jgi:DNA repair exonuclease SbcCD ATPase subunit
MVNSLAILFAVLGFMAAVALFLWARGARTELAAKAAAEGPLRAELEAARAALAEQRNDARERREEAVQLRAELDRAKKKAFEQLETAKRSGGAPALREELDKLSHRLQEARAEADHQRERARAIEQELDKAKLAAEKAREQAGRALQAARAEAASAAPAAAPTPAAPAGVDPEKLREQTERADKAETRVSELRKRVAELERDLKGARGRLETEKRVFIVQKGELELAADRYAELRRRHDALRKDHDELVEAVRQAAREERRLTQQEAARATTPTPPAPPEGETDETGAQGGTTA